MTEHTQEQVEGVLREGGATVQRAASMVRAEPYKTPQTQRQINVARLVLDARAEKNEKIEELLGILTAARDALAGCVRIAGSFPMRLSDAVRSAHGLLDAVLNSPQEPTDAE